MSNKSLVKGAAVLAVAGIFVKVLGAVFRIPLANYIGTEGMANYSPAYYLYAFLLVIATAGLPVAISKMVSERCAVGQFREAERVFKVSRTLMIALGVVGFCLLFFFSDSIADLINIKGASLSMKATAPALLLVPLMSSYRGYFQGMQNMVPTAVSEITEQIFRVAVGLAAAYFMMNSATIAADYENIERGAAGGCFGASAGAVGGLATILVIYFMVRRQIKGRIHRDRTTEHESSAEILKKIVVIAIPITIGATIMPLVNLIDAAIVKSRLLDAGFSNSMANDIYGQLTGLAEPIIGFPQVLISAIVVSLVPMVAAANRLKNKGDLQNSISMGLRFSMILAFPCAAGLFVLAAPVLMLLYPAQKASAMNAAPCLQVMALSFILLALINTMTGILQGIGRQVYPVIYLFTGMIFKLAVTWILTAVPSINIVGAAMGTMAAYIVAAFLDFRAMKKFTKVELSAKLIIVKPLISAAVMAVPVFFVYKVIYALLGSNSLATLLAILTGVIIYGLMIIKIKAVTRDELMMNSLGRKAAAVCDRLRLW